MNIFDAIVIAVTLLAVIMGYQAGLLRSLATIFGYVLAAPVAIVAAPKLAPLLTTQKAIGEQNGLLFFVVFLALGLLIGTMLRKAVSFAVGEEIGVPDRAAGALLGAVRIALLAILMVLIFERIIPQNQQPAWLAESQLRPILSATARHGVRSLPPDLTAQIDRLKKEHGI